VPTLVERAAAAPAILRDRAAAAAYVALVCFKHGPPRLPGVELLCAEDVPLEGAQQ
jgi:hypothetical protein